MVENKTEIIEFKDFDGHIILFCKNHYQSDISNIEGLRRIWALRCGYDYVEGSQSSDRFIANKLYEILKTILSKKHEFFYEILHYEIERRDRHEDSNPIETLISIYFSEIAFASVKDEKDGIITKKVILPKPQKKLFNKILNGTCSHDDYDLVKKSL